MSLKASLDYIVISRLVSTTKQDETGRFNKIIVSRNFISFYRLSPQH